jgi:FlaA1/EpsC-like NDP-sugar epimerase
LPQVALTLAAFASLRLYRRRLSLAVLDDVPSIFGGVAFGLLAVVAVAATRSVETDTVPALVTTGVLLVCVIAVRNAAFTVAKRLRRHEEVHDNALIIGAGHVGILLGEVLQEHTEYGVSPIGYIDSNPGSVRATGCRPRCSAATRRWPRSSSSSTSRTSSWRSADCARSRWSTSCAPATGWTSRS